MISQDVKPAQVSKSSVEMRQHILTAAGDLMAEKGIKETSLKDIAQKAGISQGTLYYYYSAKGDIIYDIADSNLKRITDGLLAWIENGNSSAPPGHILKAVFEQILEGETRGKLHLYLLSEAATTDSCLNDKFRKRYSDWRKMMEQGLNTLIPNKSANHEALSYMILAVLDGLMIQRMFGADAIPIDGIEKLLMNVQED